MWIGTLVKGEAAVAVVNLIYLPMSVLSGLWIPLMIFPPVMQQIAVIWPAWHLSQMALGVIGQVHGVRYAMHAAVLLAMTALFLPWRRSGYGRSGQLPAALDQLRSARVPGNSNPMDARQERGRDDDLNATPFGLAYMAFLFLPLFFWRDRPTSAIVASVVATALFVPVYLSFYRLPERFHVWLALLIAALGYSVIPFNPGGNTLIIYAMAFLAGCLRPRAAVMLSTALVVLMAIEYYLVMPSATMAFASVLVVVVIGTMVVSGILYSRARAWRNAELRLTQDEVRRLATVAERERIAATCMTCLGNIVAGGLEERTGGQVTGPGSGRGPRADQRSGRIARNRRR